MMTASSHGAHKTLWGSSGSITSRTACACLCNLSHTLTNLQDDITVHCRLYVCTDMQHYDMTLSKIEHVIVGEQGCVVTMLMQQAIPQM